ncbi:MAG: error-prone DNA polymerase [Dehalococcoidia bacterium]|nr:error-prone DNA polymerase [Dehalococcoidia bacterium]
MNNYVELHCHSNFSILDGASHSEDLVARASEIGIPALALTDHDGLYGIIPFYKACLAAGLKPVIGVEMTLKNGSHITLLAKNNRGYSNLCRLITRAHLEHRKGSPAIDKKGLAQYSGDLICLSGCRKGEITTLIASARTEKAHEAARGYIDIFGQEDFYIELQNNLYPEDKRICHALVKLAKDFDLGCVATNNVHYATTESHRLHDVLTCIRNRTTLDKCDTLRLNSEFHLKSSKEMTELFQEYPKAISNTITIAEKCTANLDFSQYRFPDFPLPEGDTAASYLAKLCWQKIHKKYANMNPEIEAKVNYELNLIEKLGLSGYFLVVWDIMDYAERNGIPAHGRGSAANSIVAYILGITKVDPIKNKLFLGRFLNEEMSSVPDIDIDVSTAHRERLIQYVYEKYEREHAAMVCTYVTFQARNAIREVGKALGMPPELIDRMAKSVSVYDAKGIEQDLAGLNDFKSYFSSAPWQQFISLCREIADFPRHLSIHNGGMIISSRTLSEIVPLEKATMPGRIVCQWDKDDIADSGLIKVDLLGLRMLSLIREACQLAEENHKTKLDLDRLPLDDREVYDMICKGDTIGVFQVESRAQLQTLPQTKPHSIEDLTIEVALVRPGPLQGHMVHPYIRRRKHLEKVTYLHPKLKPILEETLGIILFQEQVIQVATAIADFTPGEADSLRRAMTRKKPTKAMDEMRQRFIEGAKRNGVDNDRASRIFQALEGFAEYGFCKSHAAGFALLCYQSAWLKRYYPVEFYCALLNNQPMGFYSPEVIVRDAKRHGIEVLPADINKSNDRCTIEGGKIRLGFRYIKELGEKAMSQIMAERQSVPYLSFDDFYFRARLARKPMENLILAGAFDSFGCQRRQLLWRLGPLEKNSPRELPLEFGDTSVSLPDFTDLDEMKADYEVQGLSTKYHPMHALTKDISRDGLLKSSEIARLPSNARVRIAGYVITRQRPPTAKGFAFMTLEDEEGMLNVIIKPDVYCRYRQIFKLEPLILVQGTIQRQNDILNIVADRLIRPCDEWQKQISST